MLKYRDISYVQDATVSSNVETVIKILQDAGLEDCSVNDRRVTLKHWHELYLDDLSQAIIKPDPPSSRMRSSLRSRSSHVTVASKSTNISDTTSNIINRAFRSVFNDTCSEISENCDGSRRGSHDGEKKAEPTNETSSKRISDWMRRHELENDASSQVYSPSSVTGSATPTMKEIRSSTTLDPRWWDRFQMMPRDPASTSSRFLTIYKIFKVLCYIFLLLVVFTSAVINRMCVLIMSSSVLKESAPESSWPSKTMLIIAMCFPYALGTFVYSAKSLFGSTTWPSLSLLASVLFMELLHTLGLCLLVFRVLPMLDMMRCCIVLGNIYCVPALLKIIFEGRDPNTRLARKCSIFLLNLGALLIQIGSVVLSHVFHITMTSSDKIVIRNKVLYNSISVVVPRTPLPSGYFTGDVMYELPIALFLISLSYWENFVDGSLTIFGKNINFQAWKKHLRHSRNRLYTFANIWKIIWVIAFAFILHPGFKMNLKFSEASELQSTAAIKETSTVQLPNTNIESQKTMSVIHAATNNSATEVTDSDHNHSSLLSSTNESMPQQVLPMFRLSEEWRRHFEQYGVLYLQIISSLIESTFASTACKLCMQMIGFSLPLSFVTPACVTIVVLQNMYKFLPTGPFVWIGVESTGSVWLLHLTWLGIIWLSEIYVTSHIWFPGNGRMEKIDRLFVTPFRCGILLEQSLMLRRRRNDLDSSLSADVDVDDPDVENYKSDDVVPQIYACATMWHETRVEMTNLLKSIFRIDVDHSGRYLAQKFYKIRDPDYYEFEAHIFFDDAMELSDEDTLVPNMFVSDLMDCIDESLSSVHERQMFLGPPIRTPTPYGGRLTWRLPGGTKVIIHLKDKHKIRHKKRWSQVMYMYYLLGYRILAQSEGTLTRELFEDQTTDGDYQRVKLTQSQLRRRRKAAHFTRSVIFNYVTEEIHIQAENTYILALDGDVDFHPDAVRLLTDRLKTNKKVGAACGRTHPIGSGPLLWYQQFEYAIGHWLQKATEHVFGCVTCAPGCFSLFRGSALMDDNVARTYATRATEAGHYIQYDQGEDRWLSTLLLQQGYRIEYCAAADALTHAPETFSEFFNQRRRWGPSTLVNIVDLLGSWRGIVSINDNVSTLYIMYQFCLMVSTILGPATILLMLAGAFVVVFKLTVIESYLAALIPAIFFIVVCIYAKPATQMTIASIMSAVYAILMTIVFVGTIGQAIKGGLTSPNVIFMVLLVVIFFIAALMHPEEFFCVIPGALYFICLPTGYLLLTIYYLCNMNVVSWGTREVPTRKTREEREEEERIAEENRLKKEAKKKGFFGWLGLNSFFRELSAVMKQIRNDVTASEKTKTDELLEELIFELKSERKSTLGEEKCETVNEVKKQHEEKVEPKATEITKTEKAVNHIPVWLRREEIDNPGWLNSAVCGNGPIKRLSDKETAFWNQIIARYLHPLVEDKAHQVKVQGDLKNLRNNVVFGFFMTSALWIALTMQLQILQEDLREALFFKIPRWDVTEDLSFEPLGLLFLSFFAIILCVQFLGMFVHRWGTMLHMLSITDISCGKHFTEKDKVRDIITKTMELQKLCNIENEPIPSYDEPLLEYDMEDEEDYIDSLSTVTGESNVHNDADGSPHVKADNQQAHWEHDIFNTRGNASGAALRLAFEKRFRYENQERHDDDEWADDDNCHNSNTNNEETAQHDSNV
ncbi:hypothetical protein ACF0H5_012667 [Mactra antiquata]